MGRGQREAKGKLGKKLASVQGKQKGKKKRNTEIQTFLWLEKLTASRPPNSEKWTLKEFKQQKPNKPRVNKGIVNQVKCHTKDIGFIPDLS